MVFYSKVKVTSIISECNHAYYRPQKSTDNIPFYFYTEILFSVTLYCLWHHAHAAPFSTQVTTLHCQQTQYFWSNHWLQFGPKWAISRLCYALCAVEATSGSCSTTSGAHLHTAYETLYSTKEQFGLLSRRRQETSAEALRARGAWADWRYSDRWICQKHLGVNHVWTKQQLHAYDITVTNLRKKHTRNSHTKPLITVTELLSSLNV